MPGNKGEVLISEEFSRKLNVNPGDRITLIGSTMNGSMTIYNFAISGTLSFGTEVLDRGTVIADIEDVRNALDMADAAGEILGFSKNSFYDDEVAAGDAMIFNSANSGSPDEFTPIMKTLSQQGSMGQYVKMTDNLSNYIAMLFVFAMSLVLWNAGLLGGLRRYGEVGIRLAMGEEKGACLSHNDLGIGNNWSCRIGNRHIFWPLFCMAGSKVRNRYIRVNERFINNGSFNPEDPYNAGGFLYRFRTRTFVHRYWHNALRHRNLQEANRKALQGTGSMKKTGMMKKVIILTVCFAGISLLAPLTFGQLEADEILKKVERNVSSENRVFESSMTIHGSRTSRTITSKSYSEGDKQSFTEYLSPAREQGTKMLKLEKQLWIYSPSTDRTIQLSGHMLRQSVMGSDLSYEDMMDDRKLTDVYSAKITGNEVIDDRKTTLLELTAKVTDAAYYSRKVWIDSERFVPLKEELFARSGQLLKRTTLSDVRQVEGRWFPMTVVYKDMLKQGEGTEFKITAIKFNQKIPEYIFTKAALKQ